MFENQVRRGAQLLDEKRPTWFQRIDLVSLDLRWDHDCVLGQVARAETSSYWYLYRELFGPIATGTEADPYGFDLLDDLRPDEEWAALRVAWIAEIEKRRAAESAAVDA